ncbi:VanZ like family protein [Halorubrum aquaticum]|uniref:VanZ like family protein n=1 Tax=Halorubrum aquaticum TaxID=387340 RepID=A0A1I3A7P5_9EURY|nr:VanZ family protein [Halorubrum aquaticum]SFH45945.1 VanZ like family protein [Halorubrum aquaticum]
MARIRLPLIPRGVRWAAVALVALVILLYSVVPAPGSSTFRTGPFGLLGFSTWLHLLAYGGLAATLAYTLQDTPRPDWQVLALVFCAVAAYGAGIELLQSTLSARYATYDDVLTNASGAGLAVVGWRIVTRYVRFYRARHVADLQIPVE